MASGFPVLPNEIRKITANFSGAAEIQGGDTLVSATATVSPSGPTLGSTSVSGSIATFTTTGGIAGDSYLITCLGTTSSGAVIATQLNLNVVNNLQP